MEKTQSASISIIGRFAIPDLLKTLEIKGCVVTVDAMGCRKKIARRTAKQGADYVLAVKKNRSRLWEYIAGRWTRRSGRTEA